MPLQIACVVRSTLLTRIGRQPAANTWLRSCTVGSWRQHEPTCAWVTPPLAIDHHNINIFDRSNSVRNRLEKQLRKLSESLACSS
mmetsp:Transcript_26436/g.80223  ORF Transcript_26436/g.80223 Transcript_26436/m.80223 type:complete len:85 (-) Transcript_26436:239-493(-)